MVYKNKFQKNKKIIKNLNRFDIVILQGGVDLINLRDNFLLNFIRIIFNLLDGYKLFFIFF